METNDVNGPPADQRVGMCSFPGSLNKALVRTVGWPAARAGWGFTPSGRGGAASFVPGNIFESPQTKVMEAFQVGGAVGLICSISLASDWLGFGICWMVEGIKQDGRSVWKAGSCFSLDLIIRVFVDVSCFFQGQKPVSFFLFPSPILIIHCTDPGCRRATEGTLNLLYLYAFIHTNQQVRFVKV